MTRSRHRHRTVCGDPYPRVLISPSDRVMIGICPTCGFCIKVDGRVIATIRGPIERSRFLDELARAATCCPAEPAAELRQLAEIA